MKTIYYLGAAALILAASCSQSGRGWSVEGDISGMPQGAKIALEGYNTNQATWFVIDSLAPDGSGHFAYRADAPVAYAELMRLTLPGKGSIVFPVDSVDHINVSADATSFATTYTLGGTRAAETMMAADHTVADAVRRLGPEDALKNPAMRAQLVDYILSDSSAIVTYYIINKSIGGKPIFTPAEDSRIFGAAAQVFANIAPEDPRGHALRDIFVASRQGRQTQTTTVELPETGLFDIRRFDNTGTEHSLSELAAKGGVVILSFTRYDGEFSPAYNVILNELYDKYHDAGLEIYQVAFDTDEVMWKETARNLPWVTVWNSAAEGAGALASYNVGTFPTTFVIDRHGDLRERVSDPTTLASAVKKHI